MNNQFWHHDIYMFWEEFIMYKLSALGAEYKKKLITADQAAAMVENGSRLHFGLGCGTVEI